MKRDRLTGLAHLARMREDAALAQLRQASAARAQTLERVAALKAELSQTHRNVTDAASAKQAEVFATWAGCQLADANMNLARQTAHWMEEKQAAARAFGQRQVLDRLAKQHAKKAAIKSKAAGL